MGRRIHLSAPGGGAACGAHNVAGAGQGFAGGDYRRASESEVLASHIVALVDCRKCRYTTQYKQIFDPPRQYRLRLFAMVRDTEPPRRLSVADLTTDPAYTRVELTLDGQPQQDVVAFDADAGWIERYVRDDRGRCILKGSMLATERVHGRVDVNWRRAA